MYLYNCISNLPIDVAGGMKWIMSHCFRSCYQYYQNKTKDGRHSLE